MKDTLDLMQLLLLAAAAFSSVAAAVLLELLDKRTRFGKLDPKIRQLVIGIVFGLIAIAGTHFGVPVNGAQMNCRDAAVMTAGLFFGAPAGIIAGLIGGIERWFAVYWGIGAFTRTACTVSTVCAGIYAAALRKFMFENKKPGILISGAIGVVIEVFHMTMVFITNISTPDMAMNVVKICSPVMVPLNGLSVLAAAVALALLAKEKIRKKNSSTRISQTIQRWLLVTIILAFCATSLFIYEFQSGAADDQTAKLLEQAVQDTSADIRDASDAHMLEIARQVVKELDTRTIREIVEKYSLAEVCVVDRYGVITKCNIQDFVGFDMTSGEQSRAFCCLLGDTAEYVQDYGPISFDEEVFRKYAGVKTEDGFVQIGYDGEALQRDIDAQVVGIAKNRHVGQTGCVIVLNGDMEIVSAPDSVFGSSLQRSLESSQLPDGVSGTLPGEINGEACRFRFMFTEEYYIVAAIPEKEAVNTRDTALVVNTFMEILVFAVLFGLIYLLIRKVVVDQLRSVNDSLAKITGGDLEEKVNVRSNAEFASLSDDINSTVGTLKKYIAEASARLNAELVFARSIQASALPDPRSAFPRRKDLDIFASMTPAKEVGGDFYDFYITGTDTLNLLIADVSGKGIPAAMFMMRAKTELKTLTEEGDEISEVFTKGNEALCEGNETGMFVTAWQGGIDLSTGEMRFANAGHNPPLLKRAGGSFEYLKSRAGFVLAGMEGFVYKTQELTLSRGDILYLYTDGVTEATNAEGELFGEERLLQTLNESSCETAEMICGQVRKALDDFVGDAPQFDDITMTAFRYIGIPSIHLEQAQTGDVEAVTEFVDAELERLDCPMKTVIKINVAVDELFSNIVRYAYPGKTGPVTVKFIEHDAPKTVFVRFEDEGVPYNPLTNEDPDVTLSADERSVGGLGIFIVKKTMDDVKYKYDGGKNILTIKKIIE